MQCLVFYLVVWRAWCFTLAAACFTLTCLVLRFTLADIIWRSRTNKNTATTRQKHGPFCFALVCWETLRVFCGMLSRDFYCLLLFSCFMISTLYRIIHNLGSSLSPILAQACAPRLNFLARSTA